MSIVSAGETITTGINPTWSESRSYSLPLRLKEIDRVDHVGFARSVVAHEAVDAGPEFEILFPDVLEIDERQFFQVHECVFSSMPV